MPVRLANYILVKLSQSTVCKMLEKLVVQTAVE